jgi:hypothetical protein
MRAARLRWALNRLRAMSAAEVGFRVSRKVQGTAERAGLGLVRHTPPAAGTSGSAWVSALPSHFDKAVYTRAADRVLDGVFDVFALHDLELGFPPRWNVDPKTRIRGPQGFGKSIDYRDAGRVGDVKYLWELNRHLELVTLAQAWHLTGAEPYSHGCRTLLDSWFSQCPYPQGLNWCVSLEHAVRLSNWAFAWFLLGGERSTLFVGAPGREFRQRWLSSIYQHCHFIARHWSRHSSANNHLLGEATGLFIATTVWPLWPESRRWSARARRELTRGALEQTFSDGVNREQAIWYHHAVADMMLIAGLFARRNGVDLGGDYWRRLEAMLSFIASLMDAGGNVPAIGDADEGVLVRLVPGDGRGRDRAPGGEPVPGQPLAGGPGQPVAGGVFRSLLATGALLFGRPDLALKAGRFDDKTRWLLGDEPAESFELLRVSAAGESKSAEQREFREGGYYVLGEAFATEREIRIVADAGPLGYLSIAAHGHADALAFTLSVGGKPILVDPGTFGYGAGTRWRHYFKGTSAHNTVVVDRQDQSDYGGSFLWLNHAAAHAEKVQLEGEAQELVAAHDGYRRLPDPVTHRRTWEYRDATLTVTDELSCAGRHDVEICWHFAPECHVSLEAGAVVTAGRGGARVELACPDGLAASVVKAQEEPPRGWFSSQFDVKVPTSTAVFAGAIHGKTTFRSQIRISVA